MNRFLDIKLKKAQDISHPSTQMYVEIKKDILFFLPKEYLPFTIEIIDTYNNQEIYQNQIGIGHWCSFDWFDGCTLIIKTSKGKEIGRTKWNSIEHGTQSEIAFDIWCATKDKTKGVAIGTNDGTSGEWVHLFHQNNFSNLLLVEASTSAFSRLSKHYSKYKNITLVNKLITPNGGQVKFYEGGEGDNTGHTNSIDKDHVLKFFNKVNEVTKESIGINELLIENNFNDLDWLHIDVEGMDDQLIMALDFDKIKKPKVIIYEKVNKINTQKLEDFLHFNGYNIWVDDNNGMNNIAFLK